MVLFQCFTLGKIALLFLGDRSWTSQHSNSLLWISLLLDISHRSTSPAWYSSLYRAVDRAGRTVDSG
jgi:hypothetical protein